MFEKYAEFYKFDPLVADNWYSQSIDAFLDFKVLANFQKGGSQLTQTDCVGETKKSTHARTARQKEMASRFFALIVPYELKARQTSKTGAPLIGTGQYLRKLLKTSFIAFPLFIFLEA